MAKGTISLNRRRGGGGYFVHGTRTFAEVEPHGMKYAQELFEAYVERGTLAAGVTEALAEARDVVMHWRDGREALRSHLSLTTMAGDGEPERLLDALATIERLTGAGPKGGTDGAE